MNYRPYTLQEAYDLFGVRSYTDVVYSGEGRVTLYDDNGFNVESPETSFQIDGIVISRGVIQARIHEANAVFPRSNLYTYVELDDLLKNWTWPDGKPCGMYYNPAIENWSSNVK